MQVLQLTNESLAEQVNEALSHVSVIVDRKLGCWEL